MSRITALLLLFVSIVPVAAQNAPLKNAALRYWQAFALMQDLPSSEADARELDGIVRGDLPWDEAKFGSLIDRNTEALATMHRATELPLCDWGLDTDLGPAAPVPHIAKARALARLNALAGIRLASQGKQKEAVDTWLSGFRFAHHLSQDGTMIAVLVASASLSAQMRAIARSIQSGTWDEANLSQLESALQNQTPYVFDWSRSMRTEQQAMTVLLHHLNDNASYEVLHQSLQEMSPRELDELRTEAPQSQKQFSEIYLRAGAAFRLPYLAAKTKLAELQPILNTSTPFVQKTVPNLQRFNDTRGQLEADRLAVIERISVQRHKLKES